MGDCPVAGEDANRVVWSFVTPFCLSCRHQFAPHRSFRSQAGWDDNIQGLAGVLKKKKEAQVTDSHIRFFSSADSMDA
jgi:hypothetical protein